MPSTSELADVSVAFSRFFIEWFRMEQIMWAQAHGFLCYLLRQFCVIERALLTGCRELSRTASVTALLKS